MMFPDKDDVAAHEDARAAAATQVQSWKEHCMACTSPEQLASLIVSDLHKRFRDGDYNPAVFAPWSHKLMEGHPEWDEYALMFALNQAIRSLLDMRNVDDVMVTKTYGRVFNIRIFVKPHVLWPPASTPA